MLTCKHATELLSQAQDRQLSFPERVSLRVHLAMCNDCTNFSRQLEFIRKLLRHMVPEPGSRD